MTLYYSLVAKRPPSLTLGEAMTWGVPTGESGTASMWTSVAPEGGEFRTIGQVLWLPGGTDSRVTVHHGATTSDLVTLLAVGRAARARQRPPRGRWWRQARRFGGLWAPVCRPLADYGDDLALVAMVPNFVPLDLELGAPR